MKIKQVRRIVVAAILDIAGEVRLHLGGNATPFFNVDELPKRTAVCCATEVESTSSKIRKPTRAIPKPAIRQEGISCKIF